METAEVALLRGTDRQLTAKVLFGRLRRRHSISIFGEGSLRKAKGVDISRVLRALSSSRSFISMLLPRALCAVEAATHSTFCCCALRSADAPIHNLAAQNDMISKVREDQVHLGNGSVPCAMHQSSEKMLCQALAVPTTAAGSGVLQIPPLAVPESHQVVW